MIFQPDSLKDKVEFFESGSLIELEKHITKKIEENQALMLEVHHVSHNVTFTPTGKKFYTAVIHFKQPSK
ncbi:DUF2536 family protein [Salipaludibacillus agaradhaerens]|uniref:YrzA family protein n=1 Tax=Salipaludibacillus agaradhaerens TaxID=76935 RepID=UPI0021509D0F|nr:YrzA family protein [Salipaludibacillus agaradhaerens]MCR6106232.1 DUF2536 family protein [Salipaludibacillus agaradhaerens]MCR6118265.1 DUF2536 family protein [Salipaludibacillus agaradhaerens]UJW57376.1 DUF2536 family protein [Bacillus sp. A116_S68]